MSNFLLNLVRRGAGLQRSVVARTPLAVASDAVTDGEDIQEVVAEQLLPGPVEPTTHIELDRPPDTVSDARPTAEQSEVNGPSSSASARLDGTPVSHASDGETPRRDASQQSTQHGLAQKALASATTSVPLRADLRRQPDDSAHVLPTGQPANTADAPPDHTNPLAPDNIAETSDPRVEPRVDFIVLQEPPRVTSSPDGRHVDDASVPTSHAARLQPQPQADHAEDTVARPPVEMLPVAADREPDTSASNSANHEIAGLIERLETLIDRLESNQKAGPPLFQQMPQPQIQRRTPARGFNDLASQRRHVDRRWY